MTLLERARATESRNRSRGSNLTKDEVDLALALLTGDVSGKQAATALGCGEKSAHSRCQSVILSAIRRGMVNISVKE